MFLGKELQLKNKETVCVVIVTFNRKELLLECLNSILKQTKPVDAIYIIDNFSTDDTVELLLDTKFLMKRPPAIILQPWESEVEIINATNLQLLKIFYLRMHENTGGAGGFFEGVERSRKRGYTWLWLMDDDVIANADCLEKLFLSSLINFCKITQPHRINYFDKKSFLCPIKFNFDNYKFAESNQFMDPSLCNKDFKIISIPFEGPLIHSSVFDSIGDIDKSFFIICDDTDLSLRIYENNFDIYLSIDAILWRKNPELQHVWHFNLKEYYTFRNRIELDYRYGNIYILVFRAIYSFCCNFKRIIISKQKYSNQFKFLFFAFFHGIFRKRGKL